MKAERFKSKTLVYLTIVGTAIGWLINPQGQQVEIYRLNQIAEIVHLPASLSGEDEHQVSDRSIPVASGFLRQKHGYVDIMLPSRVTMEHIQHPF